MRAEWRLVADVLLAILVHPVAQRSFVHAEFPCDLSDRARPVDHQPHGLVPELGTKLTVLPCHSLHHLPGQILLDRGPRTTGHLSRVLRAGRFLAADRPSTPGSPEHASVVGYTRPLVAGPLDGVRTAK